MKAAGFESKSIVHSDFDCVQSEVRMRHPRNGIQQKRGNTV